MKEKLKGLHSSLEKEHIQLWFHTKHIFVSVEKDIFFWNQVFLKNFLTLDCKYQQHEALQMAKKTPPAIQIILN